MQASEICSRDIARFPIIIFYVVINFVVPFCFAPSFRTPVGVAQTACAKPTRHKHDHATLGRTAGEKDTQPECDQSTELMCKSGACVPLESRCDGVLQCDDGSDEDNCPVYRIGDAGKSTRASHRRDADHHLPSTKGCLTRRRDRASL